MTDAAAALNEATTPPDAEPGKSARQAILDALLDTVEAGAQTPQQLLDAMVGVDPNTIDQALHRLIESGDVIRPARGTYALAPPKPPLPPAPTAGGREYAEWLADLERWYSNPSTWDVATLGPRPGDPKNRVPVMVLMMYRRRLDAREKAPRKPLRRPRRKPKRRGRPPRLTTSSCARSCSTPPMATSSTGPTYGTSARSSRC